MSSDAFPKSLSDIKAGSHIDGDTGDSPAKKPAWLDKEEYAKVHAFFEKNIMSLTLAWHLSITMGFSVDALLSALVFTGASSTPQSSLKRYLDTFKHLVHLSFNSLARCFVSSVLVPAPPHDSP